MKLNFNAVPVSKDAIDTVLKEQQATREKQLALAFSHDAQSCQLVVNNGLRQLRALRKAADDFHAQFKKLEEDFATPADFKKALDSLPPEVRRVLGSLFLEFDYENTTITKPE